MACGHTTGIGSATNTAAFWRPVWCCYLWIYVASSTPSSLCRRCSKPAPNPASVGESHPGTATIGGFGQPWWHWQAKESVRLHAWALKGAPRPVKMRQARDWIFKGMCHINLLAGACPSSSINPWKHLKLCNLSMYIYIDIICLDRIQIKITPKPWISTLQPQPQDLGPRPTLCCGAVSPKTWQFSSVADSEFLHHRTHRSRSLAVAPVGESFWVGFCWGLWKNNKRGRRKDA